MITSFLQMLNFMYAMITLVKNLFSVPSDNPHEKLEAFGISKTIF